ncbi:MAG: low molecular weight phosphotyrosine protein phosphatase [Bacteroidales bacterium]|jgi:protein-tyrosine phosphatase|nr:low molecular weight phosphotyrosine protein phosphatase [Bacteroidales bacterium]
MKKIKILFVCLGNICRSPSAQTIMQKLIDEKDIQDKYEIDSAGIIGFHSGEPADSRMRTHAERRGYTITHLARQFNPKYDFDHFDLIIGMDDKNIHDLQSLTVENTHLAKIKKMTNYNSVFKANVIPDPYYGGYDGFEYVLDLLEDACKGLFTELEEL